MNDYYPFFMISCDCTVCFLIISTVEPSVPKATKKDVVLVHPSVMSLCGLSIGQECIIQEKHVG